MTTEPAAGAGDATPRSTQVAGQQAGPRAAPTRTVTILVGTVVALSFLFGFGNVPTLGLHLGVPAWLAPLSAPAVDLSVIALLIATRHVALHHGPTDVIRFARRLLLFARLVTLALNVAEPVLDRRYGLAAFDAVGPLLLVGWSHVGPAVLHAMTATPGIPAPQPPSPSTAAEPRTAESDQPETSRAGTRGTDRGRTATPTRAPTARPAPADPAHDEARRQDLVHRARAEDALHWQHHHRPISAETLRRHLHISTHTARTLVTQLRTDTRNSLHSPGPQPSQNGHTAPAAR